MWNEKYKQEVWSIEDKRLKPFASLTEQWQWATALRNYFERRQTLIEIDVIVAMALGLSLQDLEMIYTIQFPVLQQNENDTWYDAEGKIVFTCSRGLTGVGLDRPAWNAMRGNPITDADGTVIAYEGAEPQYTHTIDPRKSELYGGQQQTFIAPYTRCDRIADYRTAWAHFEKMFNEQKGDQKQKAILSSQLGKTFFLTRKILFPRSALPLGSSKNWGAKLQERKRYK